MARITSVDVTSGIPTAGTGTVSTLDGVLDATNGPITTKPASTAPVATDKAMVVAIHPLSVNANGRAAAAASAPIVWSTEDNALVARLLPTVTANGATSSRVNAAASNNLTSVKASAGQLYEIDVFNPAAYTVFLKFYNKASAPVVASDTPIWTIPIQAGGGYSKSFKNGKTFSTGIAYAIVKLQADTDATNVVAGDLTGSLDWI